MSHPNLSTTTTSSGDGLSASQPISIPDSQESAPGHRQLTAEDYGLMDYNEDEELPRLHTTSASELPQSPVRTTRSDSPTSSSHLDPSDRGAMGEAGDQAFIDDEVSAPSTQSQGPPPSSQDPAASATLSQEVASLERFPTPEPRDRPPFGTYTEHPPGEDDDAGDGDNGNNNDDVDAWEDHDENQPGAVPSLSSHPRANQDVRMDTDDTFADEDTILAQFIEIDPTRYVAISIHPHPDDGHPQADGLAVRDAARPYGIIPTGAVRFEMPEGFKGQQDAHRDWLEDALEAVIPHALVGCAQPWTWSTFVHTQGPEARRGVVDVFAGSTEIQLRLYGSRLRLPGRGDLDPVPVRATGIGLPVPPRYVAGRSRFTKPISEDAAKVALLTTVTKKNDWLRSQHGSREPRAPLTPATSGDRRPPDQYFYVVGAWLLYKKTNRGHVFANEILVLFYIPPQQKVDPVTKENLPLSLADPLTEAELLYLPGFIGESDQLFFHDRPKYCWGCKGLTYHLHRTEVCTNAKVPCGSCGRRNHAGVECPRNAAKRSVAAGLAFSQLDNMSAVPAPRATLVAAPAPPTATTAGSSTMAPPPLPVTRHSGTSAAAAPAEAAFAGPVQPQSATTFSYQDLVAGQAQTSPPRSSKRPTATRTGSSSSSSPSSGTRTPVGPTATPHTGGSPTRLTPRTPPSSRSRGKGNRHGFGSRLGDGLVQGQLSWPLSSSSTSSSSPTAGPSRHATSPSKPSGAASLPKKPRTNQ
ncbi:hypothetical protein V8E36_006136 [Tilletia maclaganii]